MRKTLRSIDISDAFWDSFLPYSLKTCYSLALYVMRMKGLKYNEIAKLMYCSKGSISNAVRRFTDYNIKLKPAWCSI